MMRYNSAVFAVALSILLILAVISAPAYAEGDPPWAVSYEPPGSVLPIPAVVDVKAGVIIGPFIVSTSMIGTVKLTSPTGKPQTMTATVGSSGFSRSVNLDEVGNYVVEENYTLTVELYFTSTYLTSEDFSESHKWSYSNQSSGVKTFNVTSNLGNFETDIQGSVEVYSINPLSIKPGGEDLSIMLKALNDVDSGEVLVDTLTLNGTLNKASSISTDNSPPVIFITSAVQQPLPNGDVLIPFTLQDADNNRCIVEAEYKASSETSWNSATLSNAYFYPSSGTLHWLSALDRPNGQGQHDIRIRCTDGFANSAWVSGTVVLNNTSSVSNSKPAVGNIDIEAIDASTKARLDRPPITGDKLIATYVFFDSDGDAESGSVLRWYRYGILVSQNTVSNYSEQDRILSLPIYKGEVWHFTITPNDGKSIGITGQSGATDPIGNAVPMVRNVQLQPISPTTSNDLQAVYNYSDPEGDAETNSTILWYKNGIIQQNYSNLKILPAAATAKGEVWKYSIRPGDSEGDYGETLTSNAVTIVNQKPSLEIVSISGTKDGAGFFSGNVIITYNLNDADHDICSLTVQYQGGSVGFTKTDAHILEANQEINVIGNVASANGLTMTWESSKDEPAGKGVDFRIRITPSDGADNGIEVASQNFSVDNNAEPSVTGVAISPESPFSSSNLAAVYEFSDPDGDQESGSEIKWYKDDTEQSSYRNLKNVPYTATKRDEEWYFTVRPKDSKEFGEMKTSPKVKIKNAPPDAREVRLEPVNATSDDDLTASYEYFDADGDAKASARIRWYSNDKLRDIYNDKVLVPSSATSKEDEWYFTVQVSDGTVDSSVVESNHVVLGNVAPSIVGLTVPKEGFRDVIIEFNLVDVDGDKCSLDVKYNGGRADGWSPATIKEPLTDLSPGSISLTWESYKNEDIKTPVQFQISITPRDGLVNGDTAYSNFFLLDNNEPPVVSNLRVLPTNPTTSDKLFAAYDFSDPDGGQDVGSKVMWYKNGVETGYDSRNLSTSATSKGQVWYFTVTPMDGSKYGEVKSSNPTTILNTPPQVESAFIVPTRPRSGEVLTAQYVYRDDDMDKETGTEIEWYRNNVSYIKTIVSSGEGRSMPDPISKSEVWHAVIRPRDGENFGEVVTLGSVTVESAGPTISDLKVSGDSGDVTITYTLVDPDGDPCVLRIEYQGGSVKTVWTTATIKEPTTGVLPGVGLTLTWLSKDDELGWNDSYRIRIMPNDGVLVGPTVTSSVFPLRNNSLPTAANLLLLPETPKTSDTLTVSYTFLDADGDKESKSEIKWYKNGVHQPSYNDFSILPSKATARDERWHYTIKVNDGKEYGILQQSPFVVVVNAPPVVSSVLLTPAQPKDDQKLDTKYTYADADGDPEKGTEIKWYRNGLYQKDLDGVSSLSSAYTRTGDNWYFTVRPGDGLVLGELVASNSVFVGNSPPSVSGLGIVPKAPLTTDNLTASYHYDDPEGDPEQGTKVVWYKNDAAQTDNNDMITLPSSATAKNQVWYVEVQPKDGKEFGVAQKSALVIIGNTPPTIEKLTISPSYPRSGDDLTVSYVFLDIDNDFEKKSDIGWYRNGVRISAYNNQTKVPSRETLKGQEWYVTVTPKDDTDFGITYKSSSVEIDSPIPRANDLIIIPKEPLTTDNLELDYLFTDPNGLPERDSQITWLKNGVPQPSYNNMRILPASATYRGEQWNFSIKPSNGIYIGVEQFSTPVIIINSAPALTEVKPLPSKPTTDDIVVVSYVFYDPDGDPEADNEIKWFKNGTLQSSYNGLTELPVSATNRGEQWHFTIRSRDDSEFSGVVTSLIVTIRNGVPGVANLKILPANPLTNDDLRVEYTYFDTESDAETGTEIRWFKDGVHQLGYNDMKSIPSSATSRGDGWHCTVRPRDGIDFGNQFSSPVVVIGNTPPEAKEVLSSSDQVLRGQPIVITSYGDDIDKIDSGSALSCQIAYYYVGAKAWTNLTTQYLETPSQHWQAVFTPEKNAYLGLYDFRTRFVDAAGAESAWVTEEKILTVLNSPPLIGSGVDDLHLSEDIAKEFDLNEYGNDFEDEKTALKWELDTTSVNEELFRATISSGGLLKIEPVNNKNGKDDITLKLTDTNGATFEKPDVTIVIDAVNDPPSMPTSVKIDPENPKTLDNLTCIAEGSVDPDGDTVVYRFQWYKDGVSESSLKTSTVSYSRTLKGERWRCEVIPSDGNLDGASRYAEVVVVNTLPEVSIGKVSGNIDDIIVTFDLKDADNDTCNLAVDYQIKGKSWKSATVKESLIGVRPGNGLTLTWKSRENEANADTQDCRLRIIPNDGTISASPNESVPFLLDNKVPEFTVTAVANPVHPRYIDVSVASDEELVKSPDVSFVIEGGQSTKIDLVVLDDSVWTGDFVLEPGFDGFVKIVVKGTDLVGNTKEVELQKKFQIPAPSPRPSEFMLLQNYPNPFSKDTRIPYQLPESVKVTIKIYSMTGQLVRTLDEQYKVAGFYLSKDRAAYWDGRDDSGNMVASGVYFCCLNDFDFVKKIVVKR